METLSPHPRSEEIAAYAERRLAPADREAIEDHLAECTACRREATEVALFLRDCRRSRKRWLVAAPVAAAAAAVVLLLVLPVGERGGGDADRLRSGPPGGAEALPSIEAVTPEEGSVVAADSVRFVWRSAGPDAMYRLAIMDETGETVWELSTADTVAVPAPRVGFEGGRTYYWYVDALLADGAEASTGARELRIRAP